MTPPTSVGRRAHPGIARCPGSLRRRPDSGRRPWSRAPRGSPSTSSAGTTLPPSWLTALCGPAAPTLTCICFSSARPRSPTRLIAALDPARPRPGHGAAGPTASSAWPTTAAPRRADEHRPGRRRAPSRDGRADAMVSAGSTGATVTAAVLGLGRWPGCADPRWPPSCPAVAGPVVLLDVGGSLEARPADPGPARRARRRLRRGGPGDRRARGSGCSRSAPSRARATGSAGPPTPRCAAHRCPAARRYVGLVEGYDVALGAPRRRGGHRRLHR